MIYCVVPSPLEDELYSKLVDHYRADPAVTVILDRRKADRRARRGRSAVDFVDSAKDARRVVRDRRRARVPGDLLPLAHVSS